MRAFAFFGGVPQIVVPDNLRAGVTKAGRYEPELNPTYAALAHHYGVAVIPARVRKPRDKATVEAGVPLVERWMLARLRHQPFFSLTELNAAILACLERLNTRPFKKLLGGRQSQFETVDRPALQPLPLEPYVYAEWRTARVNIDSHVEIEGHYSSVPSPLVHRALDVRLTATTVECFHKNQRVASHLRRAERGRHPTVTAHLPSAHPRYLAWSPARLLQWAETIGPATAAVVDTLLTRRRHPEQGSRSCLGCCGWNENTARRGWRRRATAPRRSTRSPTRVSSRSSRPGSTSSRSPNRFRRSPCRSHTIICAAPPLTNNTKEDSDVTPPPTCDAGSPEAHGHGHRPDGTTGDA